MSLRGRIEMLEGKQPPKAGYDFHYLIYVRPDGNPYDAKARARLADALEARAAGYRVSITKHTLPGLSGDTWLGLDERLERCLENNAHEWAGNARR
jgi:hypothetical protein